MRSFLLIGLASIEGTADHHEGGWPSIKGLWRGIGETCPNRTVVALLRRGVNARRVWLLVVFLERIGLKRDAHSDSGRDRHTNHDDRAHRASRRVDCRRWSAHDVGT